MASMKALQDGFALVQEKGEGEQKCSIWAKNTPKDGTITGTQYFAEGITKEMWEWYIDIDNMPGLIAKLEPKNLKACRTADVDGCSTFYMGIKMPIPLVSDRQVYFIRFDQRPSDDEYRMALTSEGIESFIASSEN